MARKRVTEKGGGPMKKGLMIGAALLAGLLLSSCLQVKTTVKVNTDGSGTVDQTFLMKSEMVAMMSGLNSMGTDSTKGSEEPQKEFSLFDEAQLRKDADKMGTDVRLVSAEPVKTDWGEGYHAVYAFKDITKIQVNQNPGDSLPSQMGQSKGENAEKQVPDYVRFGFTKANPSVLKITFPAPKAASDGAASSDKPATDQKMTEQDIAMITQFYTDMQITMAVEFNGTIVSSNATFRDGNRVTLVDFQFNQLLQSPEFMKQLKEGKSDKMSNFQTLGKMFPGMKIETQPEVQVRFR